jgi:hypothetical protein
MGEGSSKGGGKSHAKGTLYSVHSLEDIFYIAPEMDEELLPLNSRNYN